MSYKTVSEVQGYLSTPLLNSDEGDIAEKIDQFSITNEKFLKIYNDLSQYWNNSIKDLKEKLEETFPELDVTENNKEGFDNTYGNGHNAGYHFDDATYTLNSSSNFVNPDKNKNEEVYLQSRTDEALKVLKSDDNLDFTIGDYESISADIKVYMTRLLMPQYERRVEVEDLNRNFWVIGQNLTALNEFAQNLLKLPIGELIAELMGLWDNIYRIWQTLTELEQSLEEFFNKMNEDDKVRLMFEYGYGIYDGKNPTINATLFTKSNAAQYGVIPWISKQKLVNGDTSKWVYYVQYNKKLSDNFIGVEGSCTVDDPEAKVTDINNTIQKVGEINTSLIQKLTNQNCSLIKLETGIITHRNMIKVLRKVRQRNLTLISYSKEDVFSDLISIDHPFSRAIDFYRDYLYLVTSPASDYIQSMEETFGRVNIDSDTDRRKVWKQMGYLRQLNLLGYTDSNNYDESPWSDDKKIPKEIPEAYRFIQILDKIYNLEIDGQATANHMEAFIDEVANCTDTFEIGDIKDDFDQGLYNLTRGFYSFLHTIFNFLYSQGYISEENHSIYEDACHYHNETGGEFDGIIEIDTTQTTDSGTHAFRILAEAIKKFEKEESIDGFGTFTIIKENATLPYVNWDLISMTNQDTDGAGVINTSDLKFSFLGDNQQFTNSLAENTDFGNSFFYRWQNKDNQNHLWLDFVNRLGTDKKIEDSETYETKSTIGTYTENDILNNSADKELLLYDVTITVPIQKLASSNIDYDYSQNKNITYTVEKANLPKYEDFIRFCKPYPNILALKIDTAGTTYKEIKGNSSTNIDSDKNYAIISHIKELTNNQNWFVLDGDTNDNKECYDGFYCLDTTDYSKIKNSESEIPDEDSIGYEVLLSNILLYHISSSDLIDWSHEEAGQTRIANKSDFRDPIVNLRFINGRDYTQEIEIVITKDSSTDNPGSREYKIDDDIDIIIEETAKTEIKETQTKKYVFPNYSNSTSKSGYEVTDVPSKDSSVITRQLTVFFLNIDGDYDDSPSYSEYYDEEYLQAVCNRWKNSEGSKFLNNNNTVYGKGYFTSNYLGEEGNYNDDGSWEKGADECYLMVVSYLGLKNESENWDKGWLWAGNLLYDYNLYGPKNNNERPLLKNNKIIGHAQLFIHQYTGDQSTNMDYVTDWVTTSLKMDSEGNKIQEIYKNNNEYWKLGSKDGFTDGSGNAITERSYISFCIENQENQNWEKTDHSAILRLDLGKKTTSYEIEICDIDIENKGGYYKWTKKVDDDLESKDISINYTSGTYKTTDEGILTNTTSYYTTERNSAAGGGEFVREKYTIDLGNLN